SIKPSSVRPPDSVGPAYLFEPEGQTFAQPVTITLPYDTAKLPSGKTGADLVIMTAPAGTMTFSSLGGMVADDTHISSTTTHFSIMGVALAPTCTSNSDCPDGACVSGACVAASCSDSQKDGMETDVDCGGTCGKCASGKGCHASTDCQSGVC